MIRSTMFLSCLFVAVGYGQSDTVVVPSKPRFLPSVRTIAVEATSIFLSYGSFGGTVDVDLFQTPGESIQGVGLRLSYQEYRNGFFFSYNYHNRPIAYVSGAYVRGSFTRGSTRSDAYLGIVSNDPRTSRPASQVQFGIDLRTAIVTPVSALFIRVLGNPNGAMLHFGITVGYME